MDLFSYMKFEGFIFGTELEGFKSRFDKSYKFSRKKKFLSTIFRQGKVQVKTLKLALARLQLFKTFSSVLVIQGKASKTFLTVNV